MQKCLAREIDQEQEGNKLKLCNGVASYLCRDYWGRYILPRCEFHGAAFTYKRKIEDAE